MSAPREGDSWFLLLLLALGPISLLAIVAPVPLWGVAVAVPVGILGWVLLRRSPIGGRPMVLAAVAIAIGVAAMVVGETDDAPGLVLMGMLLVGGATAFGVRTMRHST